MARAKENRNLPIDWETELENQAKIAAGMEASVSVGQFFSISGGQLKFNDAPIPGNEMVVIIADHILENVFYAEDYDPDSPAGPVCFAFGRDDKTLAPVVEDVTKVQAEACQGCPQNEWGSADRGSGKACRNSRRLALLAAGTIVKGEAEMNLDAEQYDAATIGFLRLPVTSVKGWASYVKSVAGSLKRPPHGVFTLVKVVPDPKNQFVVTFTALGQVPKDLMGVIMGRHKQLQVPGAIDFPYQKMPEQEEKPARGKKPAGKRKYA